MLVKNVEKKDSKTASFQVEVDAKEFDEAVNKAFNKNKGSISIPGFRQGKAPRAVVEGMYGHDVFYQDAIDELVAPAYEYGYDNCGLKIIGKPAVSNMDLSDDKVLTLTFDVELYPEVTLGEYKNLSAVKETYIITEEDVDGQIDGVRKRNGRVIDLEREAQMGDTADIDFEGTLDGVPFDGGKAEGYELELGSNTFVPGFEEQIVGMNIGDEKDINITFPEDYAAELAGKDVVFKVKLNGLSMTELPELDDDFVQDVSEFNTVEEYRADTRKDMERVMDQQMDAKFRTAIMTKACDNMTVEVPESMMQEKIEELIRSYAANFGLSDPKMSTDDIKKMMGLDEEAINATIRPAAEYQVKQDLLLNAIVEAENIEVTDEELEDYIKGAAESVGVTPDQIRQYFGEEYIKNEFKKEKATRIVIESATEEAPAEEPAEEKEAE